MGTGVGEAWGSSLFLPDLLEGDFGISVFGWETGGEGDCMVSSAGLEDHVVRFGGMSSDG